MKKMKKESPYIIDIRQNDGLIIEIASEKQKKKHKMSKNVYRII